MIQKSSHNNTLNERNDFMKSFESILLWWVKYVNYRVNKFMLKNSMNLSDKETANPEKSCKFLS